MNKIVWPFHYLSWLFRYMMFLSGIRNVQDIKILSIEFCSVCNLKCRYCFLEKNDRPSFLDIATYEELLREVCENKEFSINVLEWPISGCFFLHPEYAKIVEITKKYIDAYPNFHPEIILNDNLMLMDETKVKEVLDSGIVSQIICSIDGVDAESFERMRPNATFETVKKNFDLLCSYNDSLGHTAYIQVNNGRDKEAEAHQMSPEMMEIFRQADEVTTWSPQEWNESFCTERSAVTAAKGFCTFVFNSVTVTSAGTIAKCCMDLQGLTVYGDLNKNSLEEIWHSDERRAFLSKMFVNKRSKLSGCARCSITNTNNDNRYSNFLRTIKRKYLTADSKAV